LAIHSKRASFVQRFLIHVVSGLPKNQLGVKGFEPESRTQDIFRAVEL